MLIDSSRLLERGTTWFLRSRRLSDDMGATIAQFTPRVEALATRLPELTDAGDRARVDSAVNAYAASGVPVALGARVVALDTLYSTLDIVEVGDATKRPLEVVAEIYFSVSARLGFHGCAGRSRRCRRTSIGAARQRRDAGRSVGTAANGDGEVLVGGGGIDEPRH